MGSKFVDFARFLENSKEPYIELTFEQIESIMSQKLSPSAYQYEAYWYLSPTHTFPRTWLSVDYKMDKLDLKGQRVSFIKDSAEMSIPKPFDTKILQSTVLVPRKEKLQIEVVFVIDKANEFLNNLNSDENSRYLSWEHCYTYFASCKELNDQNHDILALHLAFYLASWGMYRGSSFLLQKDYKVHKDAIKEIYNSKYKPLWGITCDAILTSNNLDLIFELSDKLREIYVEKRKNLDGYDDISSVLITKILMGTLGCVPAYDRFFMSTIKKFKIASGNYNKQSLHDIAAFYNDNREELQQFKQKLENCRGIDYPEMKILDMSFWYIAFEKESRKLIQEPERNIHPLTEF